MDGTKWKTDATVLGYKVLAFLIAVLPPVIAANITHWTAGEVSGRQLSKRRRIAVFVGSFGIAAFVHWLCVRFDFEKYEWGLIWVTSICTEHILKFVAIEAGDIVKAWLADTLQKALKYIEKKQNKD